MSSSPKVAVLAGQRALTHYAGSDTKDIYSRVGENTGNMAFITAIVDQLDADVVFRGWDTEPEVLAESDVVVMPCANQFGAHTDMGQMGDLLLAAGRPVVAIGLGAQAGRDGHDAKPTRGTVHWVRAMQRLRAGKAPNILVRGEFTRGQLARHGVNSTEILGCPSLFISPDRTLGARIAARGVVDEPPRIATLAGNSAWSHMAAVDQLMMTLAVGSVQGLPWVLQEEEALIDLVRGRDVPLGTLSKLTAHFAPHVDSETFAEWVRCNGAVFFDIEAWMEHMQRFDVCVGPRFHGAMLAMQAGTPAVVVAHDSRTAELCETTGLPNVSAATIVEEGARPLWEAVQAFDGAAFDVRRKELASTYRALLEQNGLSVSRLVRELCVG